MNHPHHPQPKPKPWYRRPPTGDEYIIASVIGFTVALVLVLVSSARTARLAGETLAATQEVQQAIAALPAPEKPFPPIDYRPELRGLASRLGSVEKSLLKVEESFMHLSAAVAKLPTRITVEIPLPPAPPNPPAPVPIIVNPPPQPAPVVKVQSNTNIEFSGRRRCWQ